jgi:hypothetical protein
MKWCSAIQASSKPAASAATTASADRARAVPSSWSGNRPASRNTPQRITTPRVTSCGQGASERTDRAPQRWAVPPLDDVLLVALPDARTTVPPSAPDR